MNGCCVQINTDTHLKNSHEHIVTGNLLQYYFNWDFSNEVKENIWACKMVLLNLFFKLNCWLFKTLKVKFNEKQKLTDMCPSAEQLQCLDKVVFLWYWHECGDFYNNTYITLINWLFSGNVFSFSDIIMIFWFSFLCICLLIQTDLYIPS